MHPPEPIVSRINELLELENIQKVYYVDDFNCKKIDVEVILGKINFIYEIDSPYEKLALLKIDNINYEDGYEIISQEIKEIWENIEFEKQKDILHNANIASDSSDSVFDYKLLPKLEEFFPRNKFQLVDPNEWSDILAIISEEDGNFLIIFDQNLRDAGGMFFSETGIDLIVKLKKTNSKDKFICALLSNEITMSDLEISYRNKLLKDYDGEIKVTDFFPLSKERINTPEVFADGIKKTIINQYFERIKNETLKIARSSHERSLKEIEDIDTYDVDAILKSSLIEGISGQNTLLRVVDIIEKDKRLESILENNYMTNINPDIKGALKFKDIQFDIPQDYKPYSKKRKFRHNELYNPGYIINMLHKPIENGDVFEVNENLYILICQPCDLMVRSSTGKRNSKFATLLKLTDLSLNDFDSKKKKNTLERYLVDKYLLPYFDGNSSDLKVALFKEYINVDIDILDLIVYNENGVCQFSFPDNNFNSNLYNTSWELRFEIIKNKIFELKIKIQNANFNLKKNLKDKQSRSDYLNKNIYPKLVAYSTSDENFSIKFEEKYFDFGMKRVLKYKEPNSEHLLSKYLGFLARTAELHDFAR